MAGRVRALIPGVEAVSEQVREIIAEVQHGGDAAVLALTSRLDLGGAPAQELLVSAAALDEAIKTMPREVIAGLQVSIANVAEVASAAAGLDSSSHFLRATRSRCGSCRWTARRSTSQAGGRPIRARP